MNEDSTGEEKKYYETLIGKILRQTFLETSHNIGRRETVIIQERGGSAVCIPDGRWRDRDGGGRGSTLQE